MTTFTVWKFDSPDGADHASRILKDAASDGLVKVVDHAIVSWPVGASHPKTSHSHDDAKRGTGWGAFFGLFIGALFMMPVVGAVAGASIGAIAKASEGAGISRDQIEKIRTDVTEGTSALFVVTDQGDADRLGERFTGMHSKLLASNLTADEEKILLQTFGN